MLDLKDWKTDESGISSVTVEKLQLYVEPASKEQDTWILTCLPFFSRFVFDEDTREEALKRAATLVKLVLEGAARKL